MVKEMTKEEHLKQQQGKESMRHEAEAIVEGSFDWRSGEAAEAAKREARSSISQGAEVFDFIYIMRNWF